MSPRIDWDFAAPREHAVLAVALVSVRDGDVLRDAYGAVEGHPSPIGRASARGAYGMVGAPPGRPATP